MRFSLSIRVWTWAGLAALALTVGVMTRRTGAAAPTASEELRDAVASPALLPGARLPPPLGAFVHPPLDLKKALESARLRRFADALDAKASSLRRRTR